MTTYLLRYGPASVLRFEERPAAAEEQGKGGGDFVVNAGDLSQLGAKALVTVYNELLPVEGLKPVKKFETSETGRKRLFQLILTKFGDKPEVVSTTSAPAPAADQQAESSAGAGSPKEGQMAKKTKKAKKAAKKAATPRAVAPATVKLGAGNAPPAGTSCGCYIRSLIMEGLGTPAILAKVKKHYPDSTSKGSDVSWNRQRLANHYKVKGIPDAREANKEE